MLILYYIILYYVYYIIYIYIYIYIYIFLKNKEIVKSKCSRLLFFTHALLHPHYLIYPDIHILVPRYPDIHSPRTPETSPIASAPWYPFSDAKGCDVALR